MSDDTTADETPAEENAEEQAPAADEAAEQMADETPVEEPEAQADEEPEAKAADEPEAKAAEETTADAEGASADATTKEAPAESAGDPSTARVFVTETGYRVVSLWSEPEEVQLRAGRHGEMVAHQLYPVGNLPEKVQRSLNPLKASKKGA